MWTIYRNTDISQLGLGLNCWGTVNKWRSLKCQFKILWQETGGMDTDGLLTILILLILCLGQPWGILILGYVLTEYMNFAYLVLEGTMCHWHSILKLKAHKLTDIEEGKILLICSGGIVMKLLDIYFNIANYIWSACLLICLYVFVYRYMLKLEYKLQEESIFSFYFLGFRDLTCVIRLDMNHFMVQFSIYFVYEISIYFTMITQQIHF